MLSFVVSLVLQLQLRRWRPSRQRGRLAAAMAALLGQQWLATASALPGGTAPPSESLFCVPRFVSFRLLCRVSRRAALRLKRRPPCRRL